MKKISIIPSLLFSAVFIFNTGCSEKNEVTEPQYSCTLSIECSAAFDENSGLDAEKAKMLPEDGIIFSEQKVSFSEGESVFDILERVCRENKIHLDSSYSAAFGSEYIKAINNLYETDCTKTSGWTFYLNGGFSDLGCSQQTVADGDKIEWSYVIFEENFSDEESTQAE